MLESIKMYDPDFGSEYNKFGIGNMPSYEIFGGNNFLNIAMKALKPKHFNDSFEISDIEISDDEFSVDGDTVSGEEIDDIDRLKSEKAFSKQFDAEVKRKKHEIEETFISGLKSGVLSDNIIVYETGKLNAQGKLEPSLKARLPSALKNTAIVLKAALEIDRTKIGDTNPARLKQVEAALDIVEKHISDPDTYDLNDLKLPRNVLHNVHEPSKTIVTIHPDFTIWNKPNQQKLVAKGIERENLGDYVMDLRREGVRVPSYLTSLFDFRDMIGPNELIPYFNLDEATKRADVFAAAEDSAERERQLMEWFDKTNAERESDVIIEDEEPFLSEFKKNYDISPHESLFSPPTSLSTSMMLATPFNVSSGMSEFKGLTGKMKQSSVLAPTSTKNIIYPSETGTTGKIKTPTSSRGNTPSGSKSAKPPSTGSKPTTYGSKTAKPLTSAKPKVTPAESTKPPESPKPEVTTSADAKSATPPSTPKQTEAEQGFVKQEVEKINKKLKGDKPVITTTTTTTTVSPLEDIANPTKIIESLKPTTNLPLPAEKEKVKTDVILDDIPISIDNEESGSEKLNNLIRNKGNYLKLITANNKELDVNEFLHLPGKIYFSKKFGGFPKKKSVDTMYVQYEKVGKDGYPIPIIAIQKKNTRNDISKRIRYINEDIEPNPSKDVINIKFNTSNLGVPVPISGYHKIYNNEYVPHEVYNYLLYVKKKYDTGSKKRSIGKYWEIFNEDINPIKKPIVKPIVKPIEKTIKKHSVVTKSENPIKKHVEETYELQDKKNIIKFKGKKGKKGKGKEIVKKRSSR